MNYLLDTNTVSELTKAQPDRAVVAWLQNHHHDCFLSAITIGEMVKGIELLPEGRKRRRLARELAFVQEDYRDKILPYDEVTAVEWGRLYAKAKKSNRILPLEDSLIEATAIAYELTVATHNKSDFFLVSTVDPWTYRDLIE